MITIKNNLYIVKSRQITKFSLNFNSNQKSCCGCKIAENIRNVKFWSKITINNTCVNIIYNINIKVSFEVKKKCE